ncbi:hypothetical protein HDF18_01240 [Mucilaginibacter sp. X5P1]|uniref:hypothetical protein n=1 Tax=Mucilaginibacter sp. X5P1 TaxID=2723088 RepID=UPI00160F5612|nr:hypothetical protein [Mucilaginibacter sp. X5P1]MBB6138272.1 hypothetical protein [Mucilaginibacter sp. X5P1]
MTILPLSMLPVYEKDGFLFFKNKKDPVSKDDKLIVDVSKIDLTVIYMQRNNLKNVMINSSYFPVNDLSFLKKMQFMQRISIVDRNHDISPVNDLHELRQIGVEGFNGFIDFNNFPNLESLGIDWSNKLKNLENATSLKWLWLNNYKDVSFERFTNFSHLTYLYLYRPSIVSLKGIDGMISLNELNIDTASKLESIDGIEKLNHLECLYIYLAKKLNIYYPISKVISLKQLELRQTGETQSINFIKSLTHLEKVVLGFKVLDGNMSDLKGIKKVGFIDFPHYSHKMKDFQ